MTILEATITEFVWMNPHSQVKFDAVDENGMARHWNIEAPPPTMLWRGEFRAQGRIRALPFTSGIF